MLLYNKKIQRREQRLCSFDLAWCTNGPERRAVLYNNRHGWVRKYIVDKQIGYMYRFVPKIPIEIPTRGGFIYQLDCAERVVYGECSYYFAGINHDEFRMRLAEYPPQVTWNIRSIPSPTNPNAKIITSIACIEH